MKKKKKNDRVGRIASTGQALEAIRHSALFLANSTGLDAEIRIDTRTGVLRIVLK